MAGIKVVLTTDVTSLFDEIGQHLRYENRFSLPERLQREVDRFCEYHVKHASKIPVGQEYCRARINPVNKDDAYELLGVGAPPKGMAGSGRINPKGISYLYGASDKETAVSEVRPWKGAVVTIANFTVKEELLVADFVQCIDLPSPAAISLDEFNEQAASDLISRIIQQKYFSTPAHAHDDHAYLASQYIAEQLKGRGIQGIKYPSVLCNSGDNICLFSSNKIKFNDTFIIKVKDVSYELEY